MYPTRSLLPVVGMLLCVAAFATRGLAQDAEPTPPRRPELVEVLRGFESRVIEATQVVSLHDDEGTRIARTADGGLRHVDGTWTQIPVDGVAGVVGILARPGHAELFAFQANRMLRLRSDLSIHGRRDALAATGWCTAPDGRRLAAWALGEDGSRSGDVIVVSGETLEVVDRFAAGRRLSETTGLAFRDEKTLVWIAPASKLVERHLPTGRTSPLIDVPAETWLGAVLPTSGAVVLVDEDGVSTVTTRDSTPSRIEQPGVRAVLPHDADAFWMCLDDGLLVEVESGRRLRTISVGRGARPDQIDWDAARQRLSVVDERGGLTTLRGAAREFEPTSSWGGRFAGLPPWLHPRRVTDIATDAAGTRLVWSETGRRIVLYDLERGRIIDGAAGTPGPVDLADDGALVATTDPVDGRSDDIVVSRAALGLEEVFRKHSTPTHWQQPGTLPPLVLERVQCVALHPSGEWVAAGYGPYQALGPDNEFRGPRRGPGAVVTWSVASGERVATWKTGGTPKTLAGDPRRPAWWYGTSHDVHLRSLGGETTAELELEIGIPIRSHGDRRFYPDERITSLAVHPDGDRLTVVWGNTWATWTQADGVGHPTHALDRHPAGPLGTPTCAAPFGDSAAVVLGGEDGRVAVVAIEPLATLHEWQACAAAVTHLAVTRSPDAPGANWIIVASADGELSIWRL